MRAWARANVDPSLRYEPEGFFTDDIPKAVLELCWRFEPSTFNVADKTLKVYGRRKLQDLLRRQPTKPNMDGEE